MHQLTYTVLIEQDETRALIARVPELKRVREAIALCREVEEV